MDSETSLLHLDALPPKVTRGTIVRLLTQVGGLTKNRVGTIELRGRSASVEVPSRNLDSLVSKLDGTSLANQHIRAQAHAARRSGDEESHFDRLTRLLDLEADAEAKQITETLRRLPEKEIEKSGISLTGLRVTDVEAGLGGRFMVTFRKQDQRALLPWTRLGVGSPVLATSQSAPRAAATRGVVCWKDQRSIQVAFDVTLDDQPAPHRIDLGSDEVARTRQQGALSRADGANGDRLAQLRRVLVDGKTPEQRPEKSFQFVDGELNESQQQAVALGMAAADVAVIHGPPGTGKTRTVVELIQQAVSAGETVLACAPSNLAVDNIFERLLAGGLKAVRIGHPARVLPALREQTLDLLVEAHPDVKLARKYVREAYALRDKAAKYTRARPEPGARREMRAEAKVLLADADRIERQVVREILDQASVLCMTNTAINSEMLGQRRFDLAVIDEACQSTEPGCWIPILRCERLVLAGDHCQLPPTVVSHQALSEGFGISLQQRLVSLHGDLITKQLDVQYRMHEAIMAFSSAEFYQGSLQAAEGNAAHLLVDLAQQTETPLLSSPLQFIDTAGAGYDEEREENGESLLNPREAEWLVRILGALVAAGIPPGQIGLITPYSAQVRMLRKLVGESEAEIDTVDGFQGREKEAIVISLVRSNSRGEIGFLKDVRRMNVAMTRARRKLIMVGDSATVAGYPFYQRLLEYFESRDAYGSVWDETLL